MGGEKVGKGESRNNGNKQCKRVQELFHTREVHESNVNLCVKLKPTNFYCLQSFKPTNYFSDVVFTAIFYVCKNQIC